MMNDEQLRIKLLLEKTNLFGIIAKIDFYEGVILAYDPDLDERLKSVVDRVSIYFRDNLRVVHECDGALTMLWNKQVPEPFLAGNTIAATNNNDPFPHEHIDHWYITHSLTTQSIEQQFSIQNILSKTPVNLN